MRLTREQFYNGIGIEAVQHELDGQTRWGIIHMVVVRRISDDTFWKGFFEEGATEVQEDSGGYEDDIEFVQVWPIQETVIVYKEAKDIKDWGNPA